MNQYPFSSSEVQKRLRLSAGTFSALQKLGYIDDINKSWNVDVQYQPREVAIKVLEFLRQYQRKEVDIPIEPLWVPEMTSIKELLVEIRDNTKNLESVSKGLKSASNQVLSKREVIALSVLQGMFSGQTCGLPYNELISHAFGVADNFIRMSS